MNVLPAVALIVFAGLWAYLFSLDSRIKRLQRELQEDDDTEA